MNDAGYGWQRLRKWRAARLSGFATSVLNTSDSWALSGIEQMPSFACESTGRGSAGSRRRHALNA